MLGEGVLFLLFTSSGNTLLLPYINRYLQSSVDGTKITLSKLALKPGSVVAVAKINDSIDVTAKGPIDILDQRFNLTYTLSAQKIQSKTVTIEEDIRIEGRAKGDLEDMHISGKGSAFNSNINYDLNLINNEPRNIKLNIKNASIEEILAVAGQKPYAKGLMTLQIDMPELDPEHPKGNAKLKIDKAVLNTNVFRDEFNISLPRNTTFSADLDSAVKGESITAKGEIRSSLANLKFTDGSYDLKQQDLSLKYHLLVPELAKLKTLLPATLRGKLKVDGQIVHKEGLLSASGVTHSLGGKSTFAYKGDIFQSKLSNVKTERLLHMLGQPNYANGTLSANFKLQSLKDIKGLFDLQTKGAANRAVVKKALDIDLGKKFLFNGSASGEIKDQKLFTKAKFKTTMAKIDMPDIVYDIKSATLRSGYHIYIVDLGKLQPLIGRRYRGDMDIRGTLTKAKDLTVIGKGKEFGGSVDFKLVNDHLKANAKGATVSKIMHMLDYPQVLEAMTQAKVDYNLATGSGSVDAELDSARILPNALTKLLKEFVKVDLAAERYNNARFLAKISKNIINFTFDARNKNTHFKIDKGVLHKKNRSIRASVDVKIKEKDLKVTIRGTLDKPKIKLDSSAYLKSKVEKKVSDYIDKDLKLPEGIEKEQVKELFKKLF